MSIYFNDASMKITLDKNIRELIQNERKKRNISSTVLAKAMNRPQSWISQIENGKVKTIKQIDLHKLFSLILNVSLSEAEDYILNNLNSNNSDDEDLMISKNHQLSFLFPDSEIKECTYYEEETKKILREINSGLKFATNQMENKEVSLKMLQRIQKNMMSNLGYIFSIYALPWYIMLENHPEKAKEIFNTIYKMLKEND
ncbi:hypothetical protein DSECCO2_266360 [anaerobic digester metagenome]